MTHYQDPRGRGYEAQGGYSWHCTGYERPPPRPSGYEHRGSYGGRRTGYHPPPPPIDFPRPDFYVRPDEQMAVLPARPEPPHESALPEFWPQFQAEFMANAELMLYDWWNQLPRTVDPLAELDRLLFGAEQTEEVLEPVASFAAPDSISGKHLDATPADCIAAPLPLASPATTLPPAESEPMTSPEQPVASPKQPVASPKQPMVSPEQPVASPKQPMVSPEQTMGPKVLWSMAIKGKEEDEQRFIDAIDLGMNIKALHNVLSEEDSQILMFFLRRHMESIESGCIKDAYFASPEARDAASDVPPEKLHAVVVSLQADPSREVAALYPSEVAERVRKLFKNYIGLELKCSKLDAAEPVFVVFEEIPQNYRCQYLCDAENPKIWHFMVVEGGPLKISVGSVDSGCHPRNSLIFEDLEAAHKTWTLINSNDVPVTVGIICQ